MELDPRLGPHIGPRAKKCMDVVNPILLKNRPTNELESRIYQSVMVEYLAKIIRGNIELHEEWLARHINTITMVIAVIAKYK